MQEKSDVATQWEMKMRALKIVGSMRREVKDEAGRKARGERAAVIN